MDWDSSCRTERHPLAIASSALLVLACSSAGPTNRGALLLSNAPAPEGRACAIARVPKTLPTAGELVDSASLSGELAVASPDSGRYALLSLGFDDHGRMLWADIIETDLDSAKAGAIQRAVVGSLRPLPVRSAWSARLKVATGASLRAVVGRSEICRPQPLDILNVVTRVEVRSSGPTPPDVHAPRIALLIDATGHVLQSRIVESSGFREIDEPLERAMIGARYLPALIDGRPVTAWFEFPER